MAAVRDVIRAARDLHPRFTQERHPDGVLFRAASRYARELHGRLADTDPSLLRVVQTVSMPLDDFAAGFEVVNPGRVAVDQDSEPLRVTGGRVIFANGSDAPIGFVGAGERWTERPVWAVEIVNSDRAYLLGSAGDWSTVESLELWMWPYPADPSSRTSPVDLPGNPTNVVAHYLADLMAGRDDAMDSGAFQGAFASAELEYIRIVTGRGRATITRVNEVY